MCELTGPTMETATMNPLLQDKCAARRIARAGCVDALGIVRINRSLEAARPLSNAERVGRWRTRSGHPGFNTGYVAPYQSKPRAPIPDCPQPDSPKMPRGALVYIPQVTPVAATTHDCVPPAQPSTATGSVGAATAAASARVPRALLHDVAPDGDAASGYLFAPGVQS